MSPLLLLCVSDKYWLSLTTFFDIRFFKRIPDVNLEKLTSRQLNIYYSFIDRKQLTKKDITETHHISADTVIRELKVLMHLGLIQKQGEGKATFYSLV